MSPSTSPASCESVALDEDGAQDMTNILEGANSELPTFLLVSNSFETAV